MQNTQAKDDALAALDGDFGTMFGFDDMILMMTKSSISSMTPLLAWVVQSKPIY